MSEMIPGGRVSTWRVRKKGHSEDLAMKRLQLPDPSLRSERMCREFADSAGLWAGLGQHANIVRCYEMREISGELAVFCEWMEGGSLQDRIGDGSRAWPGHRALRCETFRHHVRQRWNGQGQ